MKGLAIMLTAKQLEQFRETLQNSLKDVEDRYEGNEHLNLKRATLHESIGELSSYDQHPGDEASDLYEREKDLGLSEHYQFEIFGLKRALEAIEKGTYGRCETCGEDIPMERLEALPSTLFCVDHTPDHRISHSRPIEEGVLMPPFGKFEKDEEDENVAWDAEDTWQELETFGSSESPSDFYRPPGDYNDTLIEYDEYRGYVEAYENYVGVDMEGNITIFPTKAHQQYENELDEEGIMTSFGDLPAYEHDPYVEDDK
ncbi:TraR/DksA C4-type zinc finger protein [Bacillus sp. M6-12]|uniref:TraR/DksA C4-type zinc finger protein n=1 Tax=Bacillus sp. M6-12 TaxID=2054166 RepID=UPI00267ED13D|nr:TraR/DksA C4-type zinc finger protein [Bacillus sp. M6-12]